MTFFLFRVYSWSKIRIGCMYAFFHFTCSHSALSLTVGCRTETGANVRAGHSEAHLSQTPAAHTDITLAPELGLLCPSSVWYLLSLQARYYARMILESDNLASAHTAYWTTYTPLSALLARAGADVMCQRQYESCLLL